VFPRVLKTVQEDETAVFEAAARGTDHLKESWVVFRNQMVDVLLMNGQVAKGLQATMDAMTGRMGLRSLQNVQTSVGGVVFELGKLNAAMEAGESYAQNYIRELARNWKEADGELGEYLFKVQKLNVEYRPTGAGARDVIAIRRVTQADAEELRKIYERMIEVGRAQADLARGKSIIESLFGVEPATDVRAEFAMGLTRYTEDIQRRFLSEQATAAKKNLEIFQREINTKLAGLAGQAVGPFQIEQLGVELFDTEKELVRLQGVYEVWKWLDENASEERDASIEEEMKKRTRLIEQQSLRTREAEIGVLEQTAGLDFEMRRQLASQIVGLNQDRLDEELRQFTEARRREFDGTAENYKLIEEEIAGRSREIELKKTALFLAGEKQRRAIALEELEYYYSTAVRIGDLESRLEMERTDVGKRAALEREREIDVITLLQKKLDDEVAKEFLDREEAYDKLQVAVLEFDLAEARRAEEKKRRDLELLQLGQAGALEEAKRLVARAAGLDRFVAEQTQTTKEYQAEWDRIDLEYSDDKDRRDAKHAALKEETWTKLTGIYISEEQFRRQATLDSISEISSGLSGMADLVAVGFGDATAKLLADTSRVTAGVREMVDIWQRVQLKEISSLAGGIGLIGTAAGLLASIFGRRKKDEQQQIQQLVDEFRYREGETAHPEFGRAQIITVRIEQNNQFDHLGSMTRKQAEVIVEEIGEPLVDMLEDEFGLNLGGK